MKWLLQHLQLDSEWNLTPSHDQLTRKNAFPYVMEEDKSSAIPKPTSSGSIIGPVYSLASEPMEGEVHNVAYPVHMYSRPKQKAVWLTVMNI